MPLLLFLALLAGCSKDLPKEVIEPDEAEAITVIHYTEPETNGSGEDNNSNNDEDNSESKDNYNGQNLLVNGGLEEWLFWSPYDMPEHWLCHNNYNVKKKLT